MHALRAGARRSGTTTSCSSTGRGAATATTTRRGSSTTRSRSVSSFRSGAPESTTKECLPHEGGLPLLQALPRRRSRGEHQRLRGDPRPPPAGRHAPARPARAARCVVPRNRRVPGRRSQADARLRRRSRCRTRADGLPCRRKRRCRSRPDDLPPALARAERRTDREHGVSLIATIESEIKEAMKAREAERRDALRLIVNALKGSEKELQRPLSDDEELSLIHSDAADEEDSVDLGG